MNFETLMQQGGHARTHITKAMQEMGAQLVNLCPDPVTSLTLGEDQEANDFAYLCVMQFGAHEIRAWIELTSDGVNHAGEYRFRMLATLDGAPITTGLADPPWVSGSGESHVDDLIAQLTALELSVVVVARAITSALGV
jgi:hypothetical protein